MSRKFELMMFSEGLKLKVFLKPNVQAIKHLNYDRIFMITRIKYNTWKFKRKENTVKQCILK